MQFRLLPLILVLVLVPACDSGDPIDGPTHADVAGTYVFEELRFVPDAAAVESADVLSRLDQDRTDINLSTGGNFFLRYQFLGESQFFVGGDFDVRTTTVRLRGDPDRRADFQRMLLEPDMTLQRDPAAPSVLSASLRKNANLAAYDSERYQGLNDVSGTLHIRLVRQ